MTIRSDLSSAACISSIGSSNMSAEEEEIFILYWEIALPKF